MFCIVFEMKQKKIKTEELKKKKKNSVKLN